jgi:hypothetical protein
LPRQAQAVQTRVPLDTHSRFQLLLLGPEDNVVTEHGGLALDYWMSLEWHDWVMQQFAFIPDDGDVQASRVS